MNAIRKSPAWRLSGLCLAGLIGLILALYQDTSGYLAGIWNQWRIGEYGHGYLILAISLYLIYRQRKQLASIKPCTSVLAIGALAVASLLWLAATLADVQLAQAVALLLVIMSASWALLGAQAMRYLLFPLLFLVFALPVWAPLSPWLQQLTAEVVYALTQLIDLPVLRREHVLVLPAGQLSIEEACSGLRYLLAALALAVLYGYLNFTTVRARLITVAVAGLAAILANILRVYIVVYVAYISDMQAPLVRHHLTLGWYLFAGMFTALVLLELAWSRYAGGATPAADHGPRQVPAATDCRQGLLRRLAVLIACVIVVAAGPVMAMWVQKAPAVRNDVVIQFPSGVDGWRGPIKAPDAWHPRYQGAISKLRRYDRQGGSLYLYTAYYPRQAQGRELINDLNRISDPHRWRPYHAQAPIRRIDGRKVREQRLESTAGQQRLVWYWYRVAGYPTTSKYVAKGLELIGLMTGRPGASIVAMAADIDDDIATTRQVLGHFITAIDEPLVSARISARVSARKPTEARD